MQRAPDKVRIRTQTFLGWLDALLPASAPLEGEVVEVIHVTIAEIGGTYAGSLERHGRQPTYGFLVTEDGLEAFVHRSSMPPDMWISS